jgi:tRNA (guanine37-N1)-methyltransferase
VTFHVLTIFPEFFAGPFEHGVVARAKEAGLIGIRIHNLRDWTSDRHKTVDDRPFGGGEGMLLKPEPLFQAVESIWPDRKPGDPERRVLLLSAQGGRFDQAAERLSGASELLLICGRYEGVDERVATHLADEEIDRGLCFERRALAAAVVIDVMRAACRACWGIEDSAVEESFSQADRILDCPQYTRPADFADPVPGFCSAGTTSRSAAGGGRQPWRRPAGCGRTCCSRRNRTVEWRRK